MISPLIILAIGVATVLFLIIVLRINAFLAMITAAIVVSLLAPGPFAEKIARVAEAFGTTCGKIGIVIAMAAIIGRCLIDSGAADRIVRLFVNVLGEKRCPTSLMASGFVLSIPVFFDTVFYLLLPLARSMHRRTGKSYLLLILAMGAGASITHSLVPPTPGPLLIAELLNIDLGIMIRIGCLVAICTAVVILAFIKVWSRHLDIPMRPLEGMQNEPEPLADDQLPGLLASALPILLPILMISSHTVVSTWADQAPEDAWIQGMRQVTAVVGNPNLAMLLAAAVALCVLWQQRRPGRQQMAAMVESSLMSGGVIILITSAGGAFGAMLKAAEIGPAIQGLFTTEAGQELGGMKLLFMAYGIAFLIKFAQGSSTVAMITSASMLAPLVGSAESLGYHPVYIATAIGFGAQCGNWMNDSGFWIFAKMSGLTEIETLKTWTVTVSALAFVGLGFTLIFAKLLPMI
ncbi:MAG: GntP family permease [Phycisphaerae bacterium]|nr:GntP family permease [Phycisphaerae bacterium]